MVLQHFNHHEFRIVDIDYSGLLYHDVAFTKLNLIEDVNYIKTGF